MKHAYFRFEFVTPEGAIIESDKTWRVQINAYDGLLAVERGHMPLVVPITPGILKVNTEDEEIIRFASHGYAMIEPEEVVVLASASEWPDEIDVERARHSLERGQRHYQEAQLSHNAASLSRAEHAIRRAKARLHIHEVYAKQHHES
ncbi:MAG: F0F1 ATP synthase subunit epsilon [Eubacteriales bacterium]|nr:F0F1 ATP synthase subunit epsilon [Eubacteriales bacterium]